MEKIVTSRSATIKFRKTADQNLFPFTRDFNWTKKLFISIKGNTSLLRLKLQKRNEDSFQTQKAICSKNQSPNRFFLLVLIFFLFHSGIYWHFYSLLQSKFNEKVIRKSKTNGFLLRFLKKEWLYNKWIQNCKVTTDA